MIIGTGQSLSTGFNSIPVIDRVPQCDVCLMFTPGVRPVLDATDPRVVLDPRSLTGLVPLHESETIDRNGETMASGLTWGLQRMLRAAGMPPYPVLYSAHGVGGQPYFRLKRGTPAYRNALTAVEQACKLVPDRRVVVRAITVVHGETDQMWRRTRRQYESQLVEWRSDFERDFRRITGQSEPVIMFTDQMNSYTSTSFGLPVTWAADPRERLRRLWDGIPAGGAATTSPIPLAQLDASLDYPGRIILVGPKYFLHFMPDGAHLTAESEELLGEYYAKAYKATLIDHRPWIPLRPAAARLEGRQITVSFDVPSPPLVLDTTAVTDPGNYGFEYHDARDSAAIRQVRVTGPREVTIDLDRAPTGARPHLAYALTGKLWASGGPATGPRGNLRDSDSLTSRLTGRPLHNWCVTFDLPL